MAFNKGVNVTHCSNYMKKTVLFLSLICLFVGIDQANAQFIHEKDFKPVMTKSYTDVDGTPYLNDDWAPGNVKLVNGVTNKAPMQLKYNLVDDVLLFKDEKSGEELEFVTPPREFVLNPTNTGKGIIYRNGYSNIPGCTPASYFEVIGDGKTQLIKKNQKIVYETQNIGSATKVRSFLEKTKYFLVINGNAVAVKTDKKSILTALGDKQQQLVEYIKTNNVNFKSDEQLGKLINYFNTL